MKGKKLHYELYIRSIIDQGKNKINGVEYSWDRKQFDRKFDKIISNDSSLTSNDLLYMFLIGNSYLNLNLCASILKNDNFDVLVSEDILFKFVLNGEFIRRMFYAKVIEQKASNKQIKPRLLLQVSFEPMSYREFFQSSFWLEEYSTLDIIDILDRHYDDDRFVTFVKKQKDMIPYTLLFNEQKRNGVYLNDEMHEVFFL